MAMNKSEISDNTIAIVGPTASGKSDLAIELAHKLDGVILSVDSLSVYKEIDIASAKPTKQERAGIEHFGIDVLSPNEKFDVIRFIALYKEAQEYAKGLAKPLIVVGGTSFYLKVLTDGISIMPNVSSEAKEQIKALLVDIVKAYNFLEYIDPEYAKKITKADSYRIEKALEIYFATNLPPSNYFKQHPPQPIIKELPIYEIATERAVLRERIAKRTKKMLKMGLIDEVAYLESTYSRAPQSMGAIGIKEVLAYLDGRYTDKELKEKITVNTARLAKRQVTFNKSQLDIRFSGDADEIYERILKV
jgi:tRNA dimethylallyltransferase